MPARAGPGPTASPTRARPASPPSRARSRSGCASPRRRRRGRRPTRAARRACGATARRSPGSVSTSKYTPWPSTTYAWPRSTSSRDQAEHPSMYSVACGMSSARRDVEPVQLRRSRRPRTARASSGSVVPRSRGAGDDLVLDVGDVAHVRDVEAAPLEVAADRCRTRPRCGRGRRAARRRPSGRTRTSTPCPARAGRTRPCRAAACRGSGPWRSRVVGLGRPIGRNSADSSSATAQHRDALARGRSRRCPRRAWA